MKTSSWCSFSTLIEMFLKKKIQFLNVFLRFTFFRLHFKWETLYFWSRLKFHFQCRPYTIPLVFHYYQLTNLRLCFRDPHKNYEKPFSSRELHNPWFSHRSIKAKQWVWSVFWKSATVINFLLNQLTMRTRRVFYMPVTCRHLPFDVKKASRT